MGFLNSCLIALNDKLLNDSIVCFSAEAVECIDSVFTLILADPSSNTVILVVIEKLIQLNTIYWICFRCTING